MANKLKYGNTLVSSRADETLTYTRYVKDEATHKSIQELVDEKVNKTDELCTEQIKDGAITKDKLAKGVLDSRNISHESEGTSAKNVYDAIEELEEKKFNKDKISQSPGDSEDEVMSQKAVTDEIKKAIGILGEPFSLAIQSSAGIFFSSPMVGKTDDKGNYTTFTTLSVKGYWYNNDVTDGLYDIVWTRESDFPDDDKAWNLAHRNVGNNLPLNFLDIGGSNYRIGSTFFKCEAKCINPFDTDRATASQIINL